MESAPIPRGETGIELVEGYTSFPDLNGYSDKVAHHVMEKRAAFKIKARHNSIFLRRAGKREWLSGSA